MDEVVMPSKANKSYNVKILELSPEDLDMIRLQLEKLKKLELENRKVLEKHDKSLSAKTKKKFKIQPVRLERA